MAFRIGILTALPGEARVLGPLPLRSPDAPFSRDVLRRTDLEMHRIVSGPGFRRAADATRDLLARRPEILLVTGLCGGLAPGLRTGNLVLGRNLLSGSADVSLQCTASETLARALEAAGVNFRRGDLYSAEEAVLSVEEKARHYGTSGAIAADMESVAAASVAREAGVPFTVLRVVCDTANESLPFAPSDVLRPDGRPDFPGLFRQIRKRPAVIADLVRMSREYALALRCLRGALETVFRSGALGGLP